MGNRLRGLSWAAVSTAAQANEDDKFSIPSQLEDNRRFADANNIDIVDELVVPGFSRDYYDFSTLIDDALKAGIDAFYRLREHIRAADFDVLICRDADRFARKKSLLHYITEQIIEVARARIYSHADGWVDAITADFWSSMKGLKTAQEQKWRVQGAQRGKAILIEKGLHTGGTLTRSHKRERDPATGKLIVTKPDEALLPVWRDLTTLLEEGLGWNKLGDALYSRFGHVDNKGKPYATMTLYRTIFNPRFWGHMGTHFSNYRGLWLIDPAFATPEWAVEMEITYNHPNVQPAVTGELAERLKAALIHHNTLKGRAHPGSVYIFSHLGICGECGASLSVRSYRGKRPGVRCTWAHSKHNVYRRQRPLCSNLAPIDNAPIRAFFDDLLHRCLAGESERIFTTAPQAVSRLTDLQKERDTLETETEMLVFEQGKAPDRMQNFYRRRIQDIGRRLEAIDSELNAASRHSAAEAQERLQRQLALDDIRRIGLPDFWALPDIRVNPLLRRVMGEYRFVGLNREVLRIQRRTPQTPANKKRKPPE